MSRDEEQGQENLLAVHECEKCGAKSRPTDTNDQVNVTGVFVCAKCGYTGPLRIQIVPAEHS